MLFTTLGLRFSYRLGSIPKLGLIVRDFFTDDLLIIFKRLSLLEGKRFLSMLATLKLSSISLFDFSRL